MENQMFCFQCQETAKGTGCTISGVCGKKSNIARQLDLLLFVTRAISIVSTALREQHIQVPQQVNAFVTDALFTTITNVNFDEEAILCKIRKGFEWRDQLVDLANQNNITISQVDEVTWSGQESSYAEKASTVGVQRTLDENVRSLIETITYGLKGMAAYLEHARNLHFCDESLDAFIQHTLSDLATRQFKLEELLGLVLETGNYGVKAMTLLDKANVSTYGTPHATDVPLSVSTRPGILVTGHDLKDLEIILQQSNNTGIDIYTHGEMLPAHYYPHFQQYRHLKGHYGNAWWQQKEEFSAFNGPILFTSNCLIPIPENATYRNRAFTTNSVGFPGCQHIDSDHNGKKDFRALIEMAKRCRSPRPIATGILSGGYAHDQLSQLIDPIVIAIRARHIRHFVVMAGCDGRHPTRNYYTEYVQHLPKDCIIITAGCAKYRYNKLNLGEIDGIPRLLDAGQCNDCYSIVLFATMLRERLDVKDLNELPIIFNIAWYEQKAAIILLALLSLGFKNIQLGPTLPAFLSPQIRDILSEKFGLHTISNA
ncbi:MAG: hydroxylamine reductase [Bacteroidales bacterium]|nr:hydroxylamine reductase [Bacteroidales bacterium]